jgi:hypothetical protein
MSVKTIDYTSGTINVSAQNLTTKGIVINDATHADATTVIDRDNTDMRFKDGNNTTPLTLTQLAAGATYSTVTGEPLGFIDRTSSQISWNNTNKSLSLAVKSPATEYVFYEKNGVKYTKTTTQTATLSSPAAGKWYFYFASGTLTSSNSLPALGFQTTFVSIVVLDASNNIISLGDERHGVVMDWKTHEFLHDTVGTRWETGLATARIATGSGSADGDAQVYVTNGTIWDEDVEIVITRTASPANDFEQELGVAGTPGKFPVYYRSGTGSDNWVKRTADNYPIFQNSAGQRVVYNKNTAGTWSTTEISSNSNWAIAWLVATNSITDPVISVLGQAEYTTEALASAATFGDMALGNLPFQEMKPIAKLIYKTSTGYGNSVKAYVGAVTDLRNAQSLPSGSFTATDHGSLTGRDASASHPATAVSTSTTNFSGNLSTADTDVQLALDTIDDLSFGMSSINSLGAIGQLDGTVLAVDQTKTLYTPRSRIDLTQPETIIRVPCDDLHYPAANKVRYLSSALLYDTTVTAATGAVTFRSGMGIGGRCLYQGQVATLGQRPTISATVFSISCWFRYLNPTPSTSTSYGLMMFSTTWGLQLYVGTSVEMVWCNAKINNTARAVPSTTNALSYSISRAGWSLLAVTYDKANARSYVNGSLVGSEAATDAMPDWSTADWSLGNSANAYGAIYDVKVENVLRTADYYASVYHRMYGRYESLPIVDQEAFGLPTVTSPPLIP